MEYRFQYSVKPSSLWVVAMINIYRSFLGVINIVFTLSMVLLAIRFWDAREGHFQILFILGIILFPLLQPLLILQRCRRVVKKIPRDMEIIFDASGMTTRAGDKSTTLPYREIRSVIRAFGLTIVYTRSREGFILTDALLQGQVKEFTAFIRSRVAKK